MEATYLFAAIAVCDIARSETFYTHLLGRPADDRPMKSLVQWRGIAQAGLQLFEDQATAGRGSITLVVLDLPKVAEQLRDAGMVLGPIRQGDYNRFAQLADPDGNRITLAEPPDKPFPGA